MRKPLAGRRAFKAMGHSDAARNIPLRQTRAARHALPDWAYNAYSAGWLEGMNARIYLDLVTEGKIQPRSTRRRAYQDNE